MIHPYRRVSTPHQTLENQHYKLLRFADQDTLRVDTWITATLSRTKAYPGRVLGRLPRYLAGDGIATDTCNEACDRTFERSDRQRPLRPPSPHTDAPVGRCRHFSQKYMGEWWRQSLGADAACPPASRASRARSRDSTYPTAVSRCQHPATP
jgi:hypothetical protein